MTRDRPFYDRAAIDDGAVRQAVLINGTAIGHRECQGVAVDGHSIERRAVAIDALDVGTGSSTRRDRKGQVDRGAIRQSRYRPGEPAERRRQPGGCAVGGRELREIRKCSGARRYDDRAFYRDDIAGRSAAARRRRSCDVRGGAARRQQQQAHKRHAADSTQHVGSHWHQTPP